MLLKTFDIDSGSGPWPLVGAILLVACAAQKQAQP
jgi:hypothetical protein